MHRIVRIALIAAATNCLLLTGLAAPRACAEAVQPVQHEFVLKDFRTESGAVLPEARVMYGTYGTLNPARDNAILLPSHYMADLHGYEWLIGTGKALDPGKLFLVTSELFGNGRSSSPSNTPEPLHGPRFPRMTIRDNVEAVHRLLTEQLHVRHLRAVIGFSMGAQQALQWGVSHPDFMDRIVATAGTAKTYGHGIVRLESQITALTTDPAFQGGDYAAQPAKGIEAFSLVWTAWLFSQEWWRRELWRQDDPPAASLEKEIEHYRTNFIPGADANDLILQMRTWESNDVGATAPFHGNLAAALHSIKAQVLYMPSTTDLYFPLGDATYEAGFMPHCVLLPIASLWGHPAGAGASPEDDLFLNRSIARFLAGGDATATLTSALAGQRTPADIIAAAKAAEWADLDPEHTLVMDVAGRQVVIALAPRFAPQHVANIQTLAREAYWDGTAVLRVQDNYVTQWGDPDEDDPRHAKSLGKARAHLPAEFAIAYEGLPIVRLGDPDGWATVSGFLDGMPVAADPIDHQAWIPHCYGVVGASRDNAADSSTGAGLYMVIGQSPRRLDRNITVVGRVVQGMDVLAALPRGTDKMGFYAEAAQRVPIRRARLLADLPAAERPRLQTLRTDSAAFAELLEASRHFNNPWSVRSPEFISVCNIGIPTRTSPAAPGS